MPKFIERTLEPNEKIVLKGRLHWYFNFRYTVWGVVLIVLGLIGLFYVGNYNFDDGATQLLFYVCIAAAVIGLGFMMYGYFLRVKTEFAITNSRFIQKDGIFNIRLTEIPLFKVETVNFTQTFMERIMGTGSIELVGSGGTNHKIDFVQRPFEVRNLIATYMKEDNKRAVVEPVATEPTITVSTPVNYEIKSK
mgnify:FL=1